MTNDQGEKYRVQIGVDGEVDAEVVKLVAEETLSATDVKLKFDKMFPEVAALLKRNGESTDSKRNVPGAVLYALYTMAAVCAMNIIDMDGDPLAEIGPFLDALRSRGKGSSTEKKDDSVLNGL